MCALYMTSVIPTQVYQEFQEKHGFIGAYDGSKSSYYARELFRGESPHTFPPLEVVLERGDRPKEFTVTLKRVAAFTLDFGRIQQILRDPGESGTAIQALDVILRYLPSLRKVSIGRSFFSQPEDPFLLGSGREVWSGYYQSVRPTMGWKFMLNVDVAATAFYTEQSVFDFMCTTLRRCRPADAARPITHSDRQPFMREGLNDWDRRKFSREIKGLRIVVTHLSYPRKYKVVGLSEQSAKNLKFPLEDGRMISVTDYFKKTYPDSCIVNPDLPCLQVGQPSRGIYLPIDVCNILGGQRCVKKLTDIQTSNMIRHTAKPADERERTINQTVNSAEFDRDRVAREFKISVSNEMASVESRVLAPPTLRYANRAVTPLPGKGAWDMQHGTKFIEGITVNNWAVVSRTKKCYEGNCQQFIRRLMNKGREMGMTMKDPLRFIEFRERTSVERVFQSVLPTNLIVCIIDKGSQDYNEVKRLGDTSGGLAVTTQCVLSDTVLRKCNPSTLGNICLKINAKLGGKNSCVNIMERPPVVRGMPIIIFGADVTHPRSDDRVSPSIASVVASVDLEGCKYRALHRNQKHRQEIIADLKELTIEHLKEFKRCTNAKPVKIIFYRDGVSEGQFDAVRQEEVAALQGACLSLQPNGSYQPKITFIVVQKRHHTRFFPDKNEKKNNVGRGNNVPPGTTVDTVITHPNQHDFYLCSHAAIQGTSRPCHYHVIWDDSDFGADALQLFTYQLCHVFWRCNRSVSYPAPTYYAHRDAAHARALLQASESDASRFVC